MLHDIVVTVDITDFWHDWKPDMDSENHDKMRNDPIVPPDNVTSAHPKIQFRPGGMHETIRHPMLAKGAATC